MYLSNLMYPRSTGNTLQNLAPTLFPLILRIAVTVLELLETACVDYSSRDKHLFLSISLISAWLLDSHGFFIFILDVLDSLKRPKGRISCVANFFDRRFLS